MHAIDILSLKGLHYHYRSLYIQLTIHRTLWLKKLYLLKTKHQNVIAAVLNAPCVKF